MLTNHLRDAALRYADQGWPVFPCEPNGKAPLTPNGFHDATTDSATVAQWWSQWPDANIATVPGRCGCVVFDIDGVDGEAAARRLGLLAEPTLTVTTGRQLTTGSKRGRHLWFTHPGGHIGNRELVPQLEVRADNGYVMLPPSIHPNREVYQWHGKLNELKPLPPEALAALRNGHQGPAAPLPERIPEGQRNNALFRLAAKMRAARASEAAILAALVEQNKACVVPLDGKELAKIAQSAGRYPPGPPVRAPEPPRSDADATDRVMHRFAERVRELHGRRRRWWEVSP